MMKTFFSKGVAFLLAASLLVASLTSCKNDDDDDMKRKFQAAVLALCFRLQLAQMSSLV